MSGFLQVINRWVPDKRKTGGGYVLDFSSYWHEHTKNSKFSAQLQ